MFSCSSFSAETTKYLVLLFCVSNSEVENSLLVVACLTEGCMQCEQKTGFTSVLFCATALFSFLFVSLCSL